MAAGDDLTMLFDPPPPGLGFKQGVILTWNNANAANTVQVDGAILTDLPILNTSEALLLTPGSVVGILTTASSWFILGRITIPGSTDAVATLGSGIRIANVVGNLNVTNDTYALNGGPSITTTILPTGKAMVTASAGMNLDVGEGLDVAMVGLGPNGAAWDSTGTARFSGNNVLTGTGLGGTITLSGSATDIATGLTPGSWTFQLWCVRKNGAGTPAIFQRVLTVLPL